MYFYAGDGIYWRRWSVYDKDGSLVDKSGWVFVRRVSPATVVYRKIVERDGKLWLDKKRYVPLPQFIAFLTRKASPVDAKRIWVSISSPIRRGI